MSKANEPSEVIPAGSEEILALMRNAEKGDLTVLPVLREWMKCPEAVDLCGGDLARNAQLTLINAISGKNLLLKESLTQKLELLRTDLAGANPTPLERLLADRVVACWLHLHHLERRHAEHESLRVEMGLYYQRCLDHAQKRYLSAIKTLAMVRKLALPALQVNIGQHQVNVASTGIGD